MGRRQFRGICQPPGSQYLIQVHSGRKLRRQQLNGMLKKLELKSVKDLLLNHRQPSGGFRRSGGCRVHLLW